LKEYDEEDNEDLPEDLKHPGGQEETPGSGDGKYDPQDQKPHQSLESLGIPKPKIKMIGQDREKQDVYHILES